MIDLGIVPDRLDATIAAVRRARANGADVLVTTGGASVGEHDLVQQALRGRGHGAVVLEGGAAARPAADARPARRHARARPARQSGLGLRLRGAVPGSAAAPPRRPHRPRAAARIGGARLRALPANDERADYLRATLERRADGARSRPRFRSRTVRMLAPLAAGRLSRDSRAFAPPPKPVPLHHP